MGESSIKLAESKHIISKPLLNQPGTRQSSQSSGIEVSSLDETICRVCLLAKGAFPLFDGCGTDEQFRYCTLLQVKSDDGLPSQLCQLCTDNMRVAYDFRFQAIYAEEFFRKTLAQEDADQFCDKTNCMQTCAEEQVALAENMHEIDKLLTDYSEFPNKIEVDCGEKLERQHSGKESVTCNTQSINSDTDELSDHFDNAFSEENSESKMVVPKENSLNSCLFNKLENSNIQETEEISSCDNAATESKSNSKEDHLTAKSEDQAARKGSNIECNICGTTFTHINSLKQHLLKHTGERPFRCEFCEKTFARSNILNIHRRLHTGEKPYNCDECIKRFVTKDAMKRHKERDHKECTKISKKTQKSVCTICQKKYCSKYTLLVHERTHHSECQQTIIQTAGSIAEKKLRKRKVVEKPRRTLPLVDSNGKPLPTVKYCKICHQGFPSKYQLLSHQETHEVNQSFTCDVCQCTFDKKYQLLGHLEKHEKSDIIQKFNQMADSCHADFDDDKPLAEYIGKQTSKKSMKSICKMSSRKLKLLKEGGNHSVANLKCLVCLKRFKHSTALKSHLCTHVRRYTCSHCNKSFMRKSVLNLHIRLHTDERPYICPNCHKSCATKHELMEHFEEHLSHDTKSKEEHSNPASTSSHYVCGTCEVRFRTLEKYAKHLDLHDFSANQHQCHICQTKFHKKFNLLYHLELHKIQTISCKKCDSEFAIRAQLMRHIKSKHFDQRNMDYQCSECKEMLYDMRDLKQHLIEMHDGSIQDLNACDLCGIDCESSSEYYKHLHQIHDSISKACNECNQYFDSRTAFDMHIFTHYIQTC